MREERRPGTDPQKSVTEFRFGGRGRGRPENILQNPAYFSRFFKCLPNFSYFLVRSRFLTFQKFLGRLTGWLAGQAVGPEEKSRTVLRGAVRRRQYFPRWQRRKHAGRRDGRTL